MNSSGSSVSRRLAKCLEEFERKDYEAALTHFFPALDKVAKRRRPKVGTGDSIRAFLKDEEVLISAIATANVFRGCNFGGVTFEQAIYKFARNSIVHEGELDPRLKFVSGGSWSIGKQWILPTQYILGLIVAVMVVPECNGESFAIKGRVKLFGREWEANELWGAEQEIKAHIALVFRNETLFSPQPNL